MHPFLLADHPEFDCIDFDREYSFNDLCEIYEAEKKHVPEIKSIGDFINGLISRGELYQINNKFYFAKI